MAAVESAAPEIPNASSALPRVGALLYAVSVEGIRCLYVEGNRREYASLCDATVIVPRLHALRDELSDTVAVARNQTPKLQAFSEEWGRCLVPKSVQESPPDVLVIVPHASLHDVPLHLIDLGRDELLAAISGVSYVSSRSLFARCVARNPGRGSVPPIFASEEETHDQPVLVGGGVDVLRSDPRFDEIPVRLDRHFAGHTRLAGRPYTRHDVKASARAHTPSAVCVVAHGFSDQANHRLSGLLFEKLEGMLVTRGMCLFGEEIDFQDLPHREPPPLPGIDVSAEVLTIEELEVDATMATRLVLLLGCSAGSGRLLQADEPASLAETFLHIGAASVIAPMWDTDVEATLSWVDAFGEAWNAGRRPTALAMCDAFQEMTNLGYRIDRCGAWTLRGDWV